MQERALVREALEVLVRLIESDQFLFGRFPNRLRRLGPGGLTWLLRSNGRKNKCDGAQDECRATDNELRTGGIEHLAPTDVQWLPPKYIVQTGLHPRKSPRRPEKECPQLVRICGRDAKTESAGNDGSRTAYDCCLRIGIRLTVS